MNIKSYVRIRIRSKLLDAREISERVGLQPTRSWSVGSRRNTSSIIEQDNGWQLDSTLSPSSPIEEHLTLLLQKTKTAASRIAELSDSGSAEVEVLCAIYAQTVPALYVEKDIVLGVANLRANLDFDLVLVE